MEIKSISSTNFGTGIKIIAKENKSRKYLYNDINALANKYKLPAKFETDNISLPTVTDNILTKLKELGIKFIPQK